MVPKGRLSGILLPLFSLRSRGDFGIGDFGSVDGLFEWMAAARQRLLMVLPLLPTAPNDSSPYSTRSAFGLNPLFIDLQALPEFIDAGLSSDERRMLEEARGSRRIRYDLVFPLKRAVLRRAFEVFETRHWETGDARALEFRRWQEVQSAWLEPFSIFAAISADHHHRAWWEWPAPLRDRDPQALAAEKSRLSREVMFHAWLQWVAETQWEKVRAKARNKGILLCGDEPFIIGQDSADLWSNPRQLRRDARLGVPPDDFSATGQDWGLPYFDFAEMEKDGYAWLRFRARKAASYYDVRRVDHAVGYFRQWLRDEQNPIGRFVPSLEAEQKKLGERHFRLLSEGAGIIAEDLGVIPKFVRATLLELGLPGYKVMRWAREDGAYQDPHAYPRVSMVTTGTHDTETMREWWEAAAQWERDAVVRIFPELRALEPTVEWTPAVHEALLAAAENATSDLCVIPWQDVLGTRDRVNLPGSIGDSNWSYRVDQTSEELLSHEETRRGAELIARLTEQGRRA
jgi:4-alpha-glucanotransferase